MDSLIEELKLGAEGKILYIVNHDLNNLKVLAANPMDNETDLNILKEHVGVIVRSLMAAKKLGNQSLERLSKFLLNIMDYVGRAKLITTFQLNIASIHTTLSCLNISGPRKTIMLISRSSGLCLSRESHHAAICLT